jgi:hypothetical protein
MKLLRKMNFVMQFYLIWFTSRLTNSKIMMNIKDNLINNTYKKNSKANRNIKCLINNN